MAREGFEYFEMGADVGVHAWGQDLPACFRQCALAVFDLIAPLASVEPSETREAAAQGETLESLLVNWINECLYLHDIEGFVIRDLDVPRIEAGRAHAFLRGEPVDPARHPQRTLVKAARHSAVEVIRAPDRMGAKLVLEV